MFPLQSTPLSPVAPGLPEPTTKAPTQNPVSDAFSSLMTETLSAEADAQMAIETGLLGGDITQAEVMSAVKKADLSVRMLMQIRNKVIGAINEIQQMRF